LIVSAHAQRPGWCRADLRRVPSHAAKRTSVGDRQSKS
jgi:hypothetical protein